MPGANCCDVFLHNPIFFAVTFHQNNIAYQTRIRPNFTSIGILGVALQTAVSDIRKKSK